MLSVAVVWVVLVVSAGALGGWEGRGQAGLSCRQFFLTGGHTGFRFRAFFF